METKYEYLTDLEEQVLTSDPLLGTGYSSKCLPGWIKTLCKKFDAKEGITLSHPATGNLLHTLIAARRRNHLMHLEIQELQHILDMKTEECNGLKELVSILRE